MTLKLRSAFNKFFALKTNRSTPDQQPADTAEAAATLSQETQNAHMEQTGVLMPNMTKAEYIQAIADDCNMAKKDVARVVSAIENVTRNGVLAGNSVPIPGVGKLVVVDKPARMMRNPATGEAFCKDAHKAPRVKISKSLKTLLLG
jgi:DNA-binding protein HU-beta